jgi:hypothetical protein
MIISIIFNKWIEETQMPHSPMFPSSNPMVKFKTGTVPIRWNIGEQELEVFDLVARF